MALYRKTTLTPIEKYTPGMEDGIDERGPYINTLEGKLYIPENGWIATGVNGERWAIQDDIFQKTYVKVRGFEFTENTEMYNLIEDIKEAEMSVYSKAHTEQVEVWKGRVRELENMQEA